MKKTYSLQNKISLGFAASMVAMLLMGWLCYRTITNYAVTQDWVSHTQEVISTLESGLATLTDAETGQRGYLLTGDPSFLTDSLQAQSKINGWEQKIRFLTRDNPEQQKRIDSLSQLISQRMTFLNNRIQIRQQQGFQAAVTAVASRDGKKLMDSIWDDITNMISAEDKLLKQRQLAANTSARHIEIAVLSFTVLAVFISFIALVTIRRDLAVQKRTDVALAQSQTLMESMLDHVPGIVQMKDAQGRYLFANRHLTEIAGLPREQFKGKTAVELFPREYADLVRERDHTVLTTGEPIQAEETVRYPEGPRPHWSIRFPLRDARGKIFATAGISTDISDRKAVEKLQLQFQSLFEAVPGLFLVLKPDFTIVAASNAYLKATLTERQQIIGRNLFEVFPDNPNNPTADGVRNLRSSLERVLTNHTSDTMAIQRYDVQNHDSGQFDVKYWSPVNTPVLAPDSEIEFIIHRVEDVTEFVLQKHDKGGSATEMLTRMEKMEAEIFSRSQELQTANRQLETANKELESFSYSVSHDLRAPLRHIDGFVKLLANQTREKLDDKSKRFLGIIADSAHRMGVLIDDLLVFSRMGRAELRHTRVSMTSLVHEAIESIKSETEKRHINWEVQPLPDVLADPSMIRQVWVNLIANAVKYSRPRDPAIIEVACDQSSPNELIFHVRDNGVGFDMQYVGKLFGVFQRLHRSDEFEGTGIGLANVSRIIHRHGGRTWAEGELARGATFYFTLPKMNTETTAES